MTTRAAQFTQALEQGLQPQTLQITDESAQHAGHAGHDTESHFYILVVANAFEGLNALARQRLALKTVAQVTGWHALRWQLRSPAEV